MALVNRLRGEALSLGQACQALAVGGGVLVHRKAVVRAFRIRPDASGGQCLNNRLRIWLIRERQHCLTCFRACQNTNREQEIAGQLKHNGIEEEEPHKIRKSRRDSFGA